MSHRPAKAMLHASPSCHLLQAGQPLVASLGKVQEHVHGKHDADDQQHQDRGGQEHNEEVERGPGVVPRDGVKAFF